MDVSLKPHRYLGEEHSRQREQPFKTLTRSMLVHSRKSNGVAIGGVSKRKCGGRGDLGVNK